MSEWRTIPGFDGAYEAGADGRIRSVERLVQRVNNGTLCFGRVAARVLRPETGRWGYQRVVLYRGGHRDRRLVHHLVLLAFGLHPGPGQETNHKNGNRSDNRLENLEWVTRRDNLLHSFIHLGRKSRGRSLPGARNPRAKAIDVDLVFGLRAQGLSQTSISQQVGVDQTTISYVLRGRHWSQRLSD